MLCELPNNFASVIPAVNGSLEFIICLGFFPISFRKCFNRKIIQCYRTAKKKTNFKLPTFPFHSHANKWRCIMQMSWVYANEVPILPSGCITSMEMWGKWGGGDFFSCYWFSVIDRLTKPIWILQQGALNCLAITLIKWGIIVVVVIMLYHLIWLITGV